MIVIFQANQLVDHVRLHVVKFINHEPRKELILNDLPHRVEENLGETDDTGLIVYTVDINIPHGEILSTHRLFTEKGNIKLFDNTLDTMPIPVSENKKIELDYFNLTIGERNRA